jgi:NitT/TauT family transport system ATP-binding protein
MMFQKAVLLDWRTAIENVLLPDEIRGTVSPEAKKESLGSPTFSWSSRF